MIISAIIYFVERAFSAVLPEREEPLFLKDGNEMGLCRDRNLCGAWMQRPNLLRRNLNATKNKKLLPCCWRVTGKPIGRSDKEPGQPAVPFGGKYRIIDFPLSNCVNSGIETVGVLTQYQPLELNEYIGSGQPWDLGLHECWRSCACPLISGPEDRIGTKAPANAIYQNIRFIDRITPITWSSCPATIFTKWTTARWWHSTKNTKRPAPLPSRKCPWQKPPVLVF